MASVSQPWPVLFHDEFDAEFDALNADAQDSLLAAEKQGMHERIFYRRLIERADQRFEAHLAALETQGKNQE